MTSNDPPELQQLAIHLVTSARNVLLAGYKHRHDMTISTKSSPTDAVTEVDRSCETLIVNLLHDQRPNDGILGEEGASVKGTSGVRWVIDPLDGTVNFLYGLPIFAVSIAAEVDNTPVAAAVLVPALGELFTAAIGNGATLNGEPLKVGKVSTLDQALVATGFSYGAELRAQQASVLTHVLPNVRDIRRFGAAAVDLCHVACGRVDAYYETGIYRWDVAAGQLIATEAGALVTGWPDGQPQRTVLAGNPALLPQLSTLLANAGFSPV